MVDMALPLGWIEPKYRTMEQHDVHAEIMLAMPKYAMPSQGKPEPGTKLLLTDLWNHPKVVEGYGFAFPGTHQISGSCVWAGGHNGVCTVQMVDRLRKNEPDKLVMPFTLNNYGLSRLYANMRGQGEGSLGSTFIRSLTQDGSCDSTIAVLGLPQPKNTDGLIWGKDVEFHWSDGRIVPQAVAQESKQHVIRTATPLANGEAVRDAILNGYPVLRAFGTFVNPGTTSIKNGASVGHYNGNGGHQELYAGYWNHPQNGELIWEHNQWGLGVYSKDPGGGPLGGCWISLDDVDRQCKGQYAEIFAISQYDGYPAQPDVYDWVNNSFFS